VKNEEEEEEEEGSTNPALWMQAPRFCGAQPYSPSPLCSKGGERRGGSASGSSPPAGGESEMVQTHNLDRACVTPSHKFTTRSITDTCQPTVVGMRPCPGPMEAGKE
jgi:hypothetical protein